MRRLVVLRSGAEIRMSMVSNHIVNCFTTSIGRSVALTSATFALIIMASPALSAQDPVSDTEAVAEAAVEKKVIREPIYRVHKVANNTGNVTANSTNTKPNIPNVRPRNVDNQAPTILPSAIKTIPTPIPNTDPNSASEPDPVADPEPSRSMVPAKPASSATPVVPAAEPTTPPHPLDNALETARRGLERVRANVKDYSAIMVKRERVDGKLLKPEYMQIKVRSERVTESGEQIPFSIYLKFIKPRASAGREVIWVKGKDNNQICVHEGTGLGSLRTLNLDPDGWLAMRGQRYPIYEAGMENLIVKLIEKAERDRAAGPCKVVYRDGVKVNGRECSVIEVTHPQERAPYDFHTAKVYIDTELQLPIRYQAHIWPEAGSTKPLLLEEYTYLNVKINQGFTDKDFDPANEAYAYPGH